MELKEQQINQFKDEGYLILSNFFDQYEVQALVIELERFYRQDLGRNVATDGDGETCSTIMHNYQVIPLNNISDLYRALPYCSKVKTVVSQLLGDPYIRHLDQIFLKPPGTGIGTSWHTDNGYFRISDPTKGTGMWIALHDASLETGLCKSFPTAIDLNTRINVILTVIIISPVIQTNQKLYLWRLMLAGLFSLITVFRIAQKKIKLIKCVEGVPIIFCAKTIFQNNLNRCIIYLL